MCSTRKGKSANAALRRKMRWGKETIIVGAGKGGGGGGKRKSLGTAKSGDLEYGGRKTNRNAQKSRQRNSGEDEGKGKKGQNRRVKKKAGSTHKKGKAPKPYFKKQTNRTRRQKRQQDIQDVMK